MKRQFAATVALLTLLLFLSQESVGQSASTSENASQGMLGFGFHYNRPPSEGGAAQEGWLNVHLVLPSSPQNEPVSNPTM